MNFIIRIEVIKIYRLILRYYLVKVCIINLFAVFYDFYNKVLFTQNLITIISYGVNTFK